MSTENLHVKKGVILAFIILFCMIAVLPVFAEIKSIRPRVLSQSTYSEIATQKAKITMGDFLNTPMIGFYVENDENPAIVQLTLRVEPSSYNTANEGVDYYAWISFPRPVTANEKFSFTNNGFIGEFLENIDEEYLNQFAADMDFDYEAGIETVIIVGDVDFSSISMANIATEVPNLIANLQLAEGEYRISLEVEELDQVGGLSRTVDKTYVIVSIDDITIDKTPSIDDRTLQWTVSEIPNYNSAEAAQSKVQIKQGSTVLSTTTIHHEASNPTVSALKAYPADTSNGVVELDLSSFGFRAGQSYIADVSYIDWGGDLISQKTANFSFPPVAATLTTTLPGVGEAQVPTYSWDFGVYADNDWISTYNVYQKSGSGSYALIKTTTDTSFTPSTPLERGKTYTWYVNPVYVTGGSFYTGSADAPNKSFTIAPHTELSVALTAPIPNDILFVGESYELAATVGYSDGAGPKTAVWSVNVNSPANSESSSTATYTPANRGAKSIKVTVTDTLELTKTSSAVGVQVIDPALSIGTANVTMSPAATHTFSIDTANTRDVLANQITWFVDGEAAGSGNSFTFDPAESGSYTISASAEVTGRFAGSSSSKTVEASPLTITVKDSTVPVVAITSPTTPSRVIKGTSVTVNATIQSLNNIDQTIWKVNGKAETFDGIQNSYEISAAAEGSVTVSVEAVDNFGQRSLVKSIVLQVIDPQISFAGMADSLNWPLSSVFTPNIQAPYADRIEWKVDNTTISGLSYRFPAARTYSVTATGYWTVLGANGATAQETRSKTIRVTVLNTNLPGFSLTTSASGPRIVGVAYTFAAELTEAQENLTFSWKVKGATSRDTQSGLRHTTTYTAPASLPSSAVEVEFIVKNSISNLEASKKASYAFINPRVVVQNPGSSSFKVGEVIPIQAAAVDGTLIWNIDGQDVSGWNKTFATPGTHQVRAGWKVMALDSSDTLKEYTGYGQPFTVTIASNTPPAITNFTPAGQIIRAVKGEALQFASTASSPNGAVTQSWKQIKGTQVVATATGAAFTAQFAEPGLYTIQVTAADTFGYKSVQEKTVNVIDPAIAITSPGKGQTYGSGLTPKLTISTKDLDSYTVKINGNAVPNNYDLKNLTAAGQYVLLAEGTYTKTVNGVQTPQIISDTATITIKVADPPTLRITGITSSQRLVVGESYTVSAVASNVDNPQYTWLLKGETLGTGAAITITPTAAMRGDANLICRVTGSASTEISLPVWIVAPAIELVLPAPVVTDSLGRNVYPAGVPLTMQYTGTDIDTVSWFAGTQKLSTPRAQYPAGVFILRVEGKTNGVTVSSQKQVVFVDAPTVTRVSVPAGEVLEGSSVTASGVLGLPALNGATVQIIGSQTWFLDGNLIGRSAPGENTYTFSGMPSGNHTIKLVVTDLFGRKAENSTSVIVKKPVAVAISSPQDGKKFTSGEPISLFAALAEGVKIEDVTSITWQVKDSAGKDYAVRNGSLQSTFTPEKAEEYTISVSARDKFNNTATRSIAIVVTDEFTMQLLPAGTVPEMVPGESTTFRLRITAKNGVPVENISRFVAWYVNGSKQNASNGALSFQFAPEEPGSYTVQARYENNGNSQETSAAQIRVRAVLQPVILAPAAGTGIVYNTGAKIALEADGEPGATFTWQLGDQTIGLGRKVQFDPAGREGSYVLTLLMQYKNTNLRKQIPIELKKNNPPVLNLSVPEFFFAGETFTWSASAFDAESGMLPLTFVLDGVETSESALAGALTDSDIGRHQLEIRAEDGDGAKVRVQKIFTVLADTSTLQMLSPTDGQIVPKGKEVLLRAAVSLGQGLRENPEAYTWKIESIDNGSLEPFEITTKSSSVQLPEALVGRLLATCTYTSEQTGRELTAKTTFIVEVPTAELSLYWPYGSLVNPGEKLEPEAIVNSNAEGTVLWILDGVETPLNLLEAPTAAGEHLLRLQYREGDGTGALLAEVQQRFTVNGSPKVSILAPAPNTAKPEGVPVVFSAEITDDTPFDGTLQWVNTANNTQLGTGRTLIRDDLPVGEYSVFLLATDSFGLSNAADLKAPGQIVPLTVYTPVKAVTAAVNNGRTTSLIGEGITIPASVVFDGGAGFAPEITWQLVQGSTVADGKGASVAFASNSFSAGPASLSLEVYDMGPSGLVELVYSEDFPLMFITDPTIEIVAPAAEALFYNDEAAEIRFAFQGVDTGTVRAVINGNELFSGKALEKDSAGMYTIPVPQAYIAGEGIYNVDITIAYRAGNGQRTAEKTVTLTVLSRQKGLMLSAPEVLDLAEETGEAVTASARIFGYPQTPAFTWYTDIAEASVGTGAAIDLKSVGLSRGLHSIRVEAKIGDEVLTDQALVQVLGDMSLQIEPVAEEYFVQNGVSQPLSAAAVDRDGEPLGEEAFSWSILEIGEVGTASVFDPSAAGLAEGDYFLTVQAMGKAGDLVARVLPLKILGAPEAPAAGDQEGDDGDEEDQEPEDEQGPGVPPGGRRTFTGGSPITGFVSNIPVGTVISVKNPRFGAKVSVTSDGVTSQVTMNTSFRKNDIITIPRNGQLKLMMLGTNRQVTLAKSGTYTVTGDLEDAE